ncbi:hypothetical protein AAFF_G00258920 [Aldrovandia affinis]|uniref:Uncharacterized protein n=1 Tax=Aldrovandia affinis TaxID=143900 RepID=A0AAD7WTH2_9TELE|nr:hypothetical protein AAFF_G00258920 [Aldrovandia affinis]
MMWKKSPESPNLRDLYTVRCKTKANKIIADPSHPSHGLFIKKLSKRKPGYVSIAAKTNRLKDSFYSQAIRMLS